MVSATPRPELQESAARIREAIQARGLHARDVARELGSKDPEGTSVRNWMRGANAPTPEIRERLAQLLRLEPSELAPADWIARPGRTKPKDENALRQRQRERDKDYQRRKRAGRRNGDGPAAQAVALAAELGHAGTVSRRVTDAETVFSTNLRADGTMQIKLNLVLPAAAGVALVQMLYAADALKLATTQGDKMRELDAELLAGSRAEARGDDRV